jgi:hypothetical protein
MIKPPLPETGGRFGAARQPVSLPPLKQKALDVIDGFAPRPDLRIWNTALKECFCSDLRQRVMDPSGIQQGTAGLCGPASMLFALADRDPLGYVKFIIDLYEKGEACLGKLQVKPSKALLAAPIPAGVPDVDWIPMAALRNSENAFFDYVKDTNYFAGMTLPHEMAAWFKALGYQDVVEHCRVFGNKGWFNAHRASEHRRKGYNVTLLVNAKLMYAAQMKFDSLVPNHWVGLTSEIRLQSDRVSLEVFSWGQRRYQIPEYGTLEKADFLDNYYGFVAARF